MILKTNPDPYTLVPTSMDEAYDFFLTCFFEDSDTVPLEMRLAFFQGAIHLKNLIHTAASLSPEEKKATVKRLFDELSTEMADLQVFLKKPTPAQRPETASERPPDYVITNAPPKPQPNVPEPTTQAVPMMWTIGMVQEFEAGYQGALGASAATFQFRGRDFRVADAPQILAHLKQVFAVDRPVQPQPQQPQTPQQ
jgi:hypothetical protein